MRLKLTCLLLLMFGVVFLYDAITFPNIRDIELSAKSASVKIKRFTRSNSNLVFANDQHEYSIRCDVNKTLCGSWRELGDVPLELTVVRTSTLGGHVAFSSKINGREVVYIKDLEDSLPSARLKVWFYPICFFCIFMYYFRQLMRSKQ